MIKLLGKRVCVLPPAGDNVRNGEGDLIRLPDGRIMYAYSEYIGGSVHDHAASQISAVFSSDEGESFCDYRVLVPMDEAVVNRMCVSLLPMENGEIGLFYGEKFKNSTGRIGMRVMLTRTRDAKTFSTPVNCTNNEEYLVKENARVIRLSSGRILLPLNYHPFQDGTHAGIASRGISIFYYSDDDGKTFKKSPACLENPCENLDSGLQETGVCEIEEGKILAFHRTNGGCQYISISEDGGESFTKPLPCPYFTSPCAPMHMRHLGENKTIAVFNPAPPMPHNQGCTRISAGGMDRTPLLAAIVQGKGEAFIKNAPKNVPAKVFLLEDSPEDVYCYPTTFVGKDYLLCAYYHSFGTENVLSATVIKKILFSEIEE